MDRLVCVNVNWAYSAVTIFILGLLSTLESTPWVAALMLKIKALHLRQNLLYAPSCVSAPADTRLSLRPVLDDIPARGGSLNL